MIGLVWGDHTLPISRVQYAILLVNMGLWGGQYVYDVSAASVAGVSCVLLLSAFWNRFHCRDSALLFAQAAPFRRMAWPDFLHVIHRRAYIEWQPPFYSFLVARCPILWIHQLGMVALGYGGILLMFLTIGKQAALICATPLFALMLTQPSNDMLLFWALLVTRYFLARNPLFAAIVYGLSYALKPITIVFFPLLLIQLKYVMLISLVLWGVYVFWSMRYCFGRKQIGFLFRQTLLLPCTSPQGRKRWRIHTLKERFKKMSIPAAPALLLYLFPVWMGTTQKNPLTILLMAGLFLLYGNIKYTLFFLIFL